MDSDVLYLTECFYFPLCFVFKVLADKVHIKALTIAQRVSLLQQGLHDTSGNSNFKTFLDKCCRVPCTCGMKVFVSSDQWYKLRASFDIFF